MPPYIEIPPPESPWFEIARRIQNQHEELARYSSFKWRVLLWVFSSMDVFLAIAGIALGITTAVVAESSAAAARGLGAANAVVAALIALLNRTGVTSTLLWIDFRANEIRADLGELRARCSYHDPAPDQAIRDIRIALDELVDRRRALQTEVTTMAFMLFFGLGNVPAGSATSPRGHGPAAPASEAAPLLG
ncbi:hypothetical protein EHS25_004890 [Saitozyma podzolica]|uniref:SMODS and SLOG-associating 2TM effector domain-containing protein n=2 Tax=Saitozyma podzolica TaxID=1890683 RepID=A0A427Y2Z5_9TREE|nr:hypothetical protein EHS25_004890 [Saitozyma podzolica]